jgi:hypothetical protein
MKLLLLFLIIVSCSCNQEEIAKRNLEKDLFSFFNVRLKAS